MPLSIQLPLADRDILKTLKAGELVLLTGTLYTARDQAHKRLSEMIQNGQTLPLSLSSTFIYYCGPTPARDDGQFGSAGPTTSARMDPFTPLLLDNGLPGMIGKGARSEAVRKSVMQNKAVYFITFGGAGAYLAKKIKSQKIVAFPEFGTEAIYELNVEDFPVIVGIDNTGISAE